MANDLAKSLSSSFFHLSSTTSFQPNTNISNLDTPLTIDVDDNNNIVRFDLVNPSEYVLINNIQLLSQSHNSKNNNNSINMTNDLINSSLSSFSSNSSSVSSCSSASSFSLPSNQQSLLFNNNSFSPNNNNNNQFNQTFEIQDTGHPLIKRTSSSMLNKNNSSFGVSNSSSNIGLTRNKSSFSLNKQNNNQDNINYDNINNLVDAINSENDSLLTLNHQQISSNLQSPLSDRDVITGILRKRFNSFSNTNSDSTSFISNNFNDNLMALNKMDNEFSSNNFNNSQSPNQFRNYRHNSIIGSQDMNNSFISDQRQINNVNSNVNLHHQYQHQQKFSKPSEILFSKNIPCLSSNCLLPASNSQITANGKSVKFACNSCQTVRFMHQICYDNMNFDARNMVMVNNLSKSFDTNNHFMDLNNNINHSYMNKIHQNIQCNNCHYGSLMVVMSNSTNNHNPNQRDNMRKKSFCLNNPPIPVPMQPVRESRSPSPNKDHQSSSGMTFGSLNRSQSNLLQQTHLNKLMKKTSAPVNMPKSNNRFRTMSTGSSGSFSNGSSFSSSLGNAAFNIGSPKAINNNMPSPLWKKGLNGKSQSNNTINQMMTLSSSAMTLAESNVNSSNINLEITVSNCQESSLKSDAECLNQMVTNMVSKLKLNDSKNLEDKLAMSGNIFYNRKEWLSILNKLPLEKQNGIHIRLEDEGPYGNDDTRCFVLSHFSKLCIREMRCVLCNENMSIYDRFPLVDGTLYVSPVKYDRINDYNNNNNSDDDRNFKANQQNQHQNSSNNNNNNNNNNDNINNNACSIDSSSEPLLCVEAQISNKQQWIYAICLSCLHSTNNHKIKCKLCSKEWKGGLTLQVGTLYKFEIFSPFPCCQSRLNCLKCLHPIVNLKSNQPALQYFSSYSEPKECSNCKTFDYHLIKPLDQIFDYI